jgi:3-deoxy-D-manno-octulosonic-acid transferase
VSPLYSVAYALLLVITCPFWLLQMLRKGKYRAGLAERLGRVPRRLHIASDRQSIWIHAVSVGEVLAIAGLARELRARYPELSVYVSTTTLAGQSLARERFGEQNVFYFPLDLPFAIRPYLQALRPKLIVIAETEFWPNFIHLAHQAGASIAIVNSRISDRSFPGYKRFRRWLQPVLTSIDIFLAQSAADRDRLIAIGAPVDRVQVSGNLKFEIAVPRESSLIGDLRRAISVSTPVLVCGSTVDGEEEILLRTFRQVLRQFPQALMVLAPRHPERFEAVAQLVAASGMSFWRRSGWRGAPLSGGVFLLDSIGELAALYSLAMVAFVGGSLVPRGGHNILEPAQFGRAILVGTHTENFREIIQIFSAAEAVKIATTENLEQVLLNLLQDVFQREQLGNNARLVMQANQGSTARTLAAIGSLLHMAQAPESVAR